MKRFLVLLLFVFFANFSITKAFNDVSVDDKDLPIFQHLADVKIIPAKANGNFSPNAIVSKSEALTFAMRAGGISIPLDFDPKQVPNDVDPNSWFAPVVARARSLRISNPDSVNFAPNAAITKAEFLAFLFRSTKVDFTTFQNKNTFVAKDVVADGWMAPHFRYAKKFDISQITTNQEFLPFKNLTRREVAVMLYRQLKIFHGDNSTAQFIEIQAHIRQFMQLIQNNKEAEATQHLHKILTLSKKLTRKKNDKNAVATKALSKSFKHFVESLRAINFGKKLQAIESLNLAANYANSAAKKSDTIAPVANQVSLMVDQTLNSFSATNYALNSF